MSHAHLSWRRSGAYTSPAQPLSDDSTMLHRCRFAADRQCYRYIALAKVDRKSAASVDTRWRSGTHRPRLSPLPRETLPLVIRCSPARFFSHSSAYTLPRSAWLFQCPMRWEMRQRRPLACQTPIPYACPAKYVTTKLASRRSACRETFARIEVKQPGGEPFPCEFIRSKGDGMRWCKEDIETPRRPYLQSRWITECDRSLRV
ncbi:hypothetical protein BV20DRAFT_72069 [Pilatotrama ljubarskyi]|nr:hypothetical protein BV20DRAFT_72069 [Pilatotrama ljubarskyi]